MKQDQLTIHTIHLRKPILSAALANGDRNICGISNMGGATIAFVVNPTAFADKAEVHYYIANMLSTDNFSRFLGRQVSHSRLQTYLESLKEDSTVLAPPKGCGSFDVMGFQDKPLSFFSELVIHTYGRVHGRLQRPQDTEPHYMIFKNRIVIAKPRHIAITKTLQGDVAEDSFAEAVLETSEVKTKTTPRGIWAWPTSKEAQTRRDSLERTRASVIVPGDTKAPGYVSGEQ